MRWYNILLQNTAFIVTWMAQAAILEAFSDLPDPRRGAGQRLVISFESIGDILRPVESPEIVRCQKD